MAAPAKQVRFGIIGLGLMGKEFASAAARWCHFLADVPRPVIAGICNRLDTERDHKDREWFTRNFPSIELVTSEYEELLASPKIDAIYCAVPHNLHQKVFTDILKAGKHLLGEKPFGIDKKANDAILAEVRRHPELVVRCSSEFPYYPAVSRLIRWLRERSYGRLIGVRAGFHHSSDMDPEKPINWKRMVEVNGEYGCMGDLGFHTHHIPLRMGWKIDTVYASLQKIVTERPDGRGGRVPCLTWDNATLTCEARDGADSFPLILETKRMAPGATNTWFLEVYGTKASMKFSTEEPRTLYSLKTEGKEQGWLRTDIGSESFLPTVTGPIFETGFAFALLQMFGAFLSEFGSGEPPFRNGTPEETAQSHLILTAAIASNLRKSAVRLSEFC